MMTLSLDKLTNFKHVIHYLLNTCCLGSDFRIHAQPLFKYKCPLKISSRIKSAYLKI